ncbi:MAG: hypothetical protein ACXWVW_10280, partial [Sulfuricurvum sp.]
AHHKLWIDFSVAGKNGSQFQFRVTTAAQPFGYNADGSRLPLQERREARSEWNGKGIDKEKKENMTNLEIFNAETTRPWKAGGKRQDFIFEVNNLWQWLDTDGVSVDKWIVVQKCFTQDKETELDEMTSVRIKNFRFALMQLQNQWLALIKIPDIKKQTDIEDPSHDYLTMLFDRISSNGTRLSPDDLLFSMIKQSWPDAHNIVYKLQEQVGSLMKPTDFVMTAFRLAALQSDDSKVRSDPELNAKTFHKRLGGLLGTNDSPGSLRKMISDVGVLMQAFKDLIDIIKYRGNKDHGIPGIMFPYMNEYLLQVILYWMIGNQENVSSFEDSRNEILRFILFWFVCNKDAASAYKASKTAIEIVSKEKGRFPGKEIYQKLTFKNDDGLSLFFPLIAAPLKKFDSTQFCRQNKRATRIFGEKNTALYDSFMVRKQLLLWFQRKWVIQKFEEKGFTPMAGQDEDNVPYDFDHLIPQSNWSSLFDICRDGIKNEVSKNVFQDKDQRRILGNSIGNYRVMDSSENRSRGDEPLVIELLEPSDKWEMFAINSADEIELQKWKLSSPEKDGGKWDDARLLAFQHAVESRVMYLYKRYFEEAEFKNWLQAE